MTSADVILMDVRMPVLDGIAATRAILASGSAARILILTTFDLDEYVYEAIRAGASGFLLKDVRPDDLLDAIRVVAAGEALLAPTVTRRLLDRFASQAPDDRVPPSLEELTERELEILRLVAQGLSNAEIAQQLVLGETTVKSHVSSDPPQAAAPRPRASGGRRVRGGPRPPALLLREESARAGSSGGTACNSPARPMCAAPPEAHHRCMKTVIETHSLTKRFGERNAVDNVDLVVPAGVAFGFLGPNGAGKTTMIRTLLGLTEPTAGEIKLLGLPQPDRRKDALARVGAIVEEPRFHPHLTGRENLRVAAAARSHEADGRIEASLARVGLVNRADDRVKTYSLGMRQRLGIARALLGDPALLILDEPMNGLDPAGILEMRHLIRSFVDEGRTVFLSSHLLDEVEKTADEVAIVDRGSIVVQGSIGEIVAAAATRP